MKNKMSLQERLRDAAAPLTRISRMARTARLMRDAANALDAKDQEIKRIRDAILRAGLTLGEE